jgi:hypothetical protein
LSAVSTDSGPEFGEEDMIETSRRDLDDAPGELERGRMAHLERGDEIEFGRLGLDRFDDPLLSVSGIDAPEPCHAVENPAAVLRDVVHAFGADEEARLGFELAIRRHRQPEWLHCLAGEGCVG